MYTTSSRIENYVDELFTAMEPYNWASFIFKID